MVRHSACFDLFVWDYHCLKVLELCCKCVLGHYVSLFSLFRDFILDLCYGTCKISGLLDINYHLKSIYTSEHFSFKMTPFEKLVPFKKLNFTFLFIKNLYYTFLCFKNYSTNIPKYSFINNYLKNIDINQYFLNYSEKSKKNISTKNNYQKQVTNNILGLYVLKHWFEFKIYHGFWP